MNGIGSHQSAKMKNDEWLTPPELIRSIGEFDLDPCAPVNRPWNTAKKHYSIKEDGLSKSWAGRVWLNPPYGREAAKWLDKLAKHGDGIALVFARTETEMFFRYVWNKASALLFIEGRLHFHYVTGERAKANSGAPSVLIAYGYQCADILAQCGIKGKLIKL
ncbi:MAG: DNA N-6-adenine-methyltransferase [Bacteroidales bacterium]